EYTRSHNPTRTRLEENLASLENGKYALVSASGLSMMSLIMHSFPAGTKVLSGDDVYGGTYRLFTTVFNENHNFKFVDTTDLELVEKTIKEQGTEVLWLETPTNPMLKISAIKALCTIAKKYKIKVFVDNTFMSPYFQTP